MLNELKNKIICRLIRKTWINTNVIVEVLRKATALEMKNYCENFYKNF